MIYEEKLCKSLSFLRIVTIIFISYHFNWKVFCNEMIILAEELSPHSPHTLKQEDEKNNFQTAVLNNEIKSVIFLSRDS